MSEAVVGDFSNKQDAQLALQALRAAGVESRDISVIVEDPVIEPTSEQQRAEIGAGLFTGALTGAILGGLLGYILSLGAFDLLGAGEFATDYPVAAVILGSGLGAALVGLLGAIAGLNFGASDEAVAEADVLVTVRTQELPSEQIADLMAANHALNVQVTDTPAGATVSPSDTGYVPNSEPPSEQDAPTSGAGRHP